MENELNQTNKKYAYGVLGCLFIFCFRVVAQLIQAVFPNKMLPPFEAWHSGALPYGLLVLSQVVIIVIISNIAKNFYENNIIPKRNKGKLYLILGGVYFSVMGFRLLAGLTFAKGHPWFGAKIPAFFHLILALILIILGKFHFSYDKHSIKSEKMNLVIKKEGTKKW